VFQQYVNYKAAPQIAVCFEGVNIAHSDTVLYLGTYLDKDMKFSTHVSKTSNIVSRNVGMISRVRHFVKKEQLLQMYCALVLPYINYCCFIWGTNYASRIKPILILQKRAMRIIEGIFLPASADPVFKECKMLKVQDIAKYQSLLIMHRSITDDLPTLINSVFVRYENLLHSTRISDHFQRQFSTKNYCLFTIRCQGPKLWNEIISKKFARAAVPRSKDELKKYLKSHFIEKYN